MTSLPMMLALSPTACFRAMTGHEPIAPQRRLLLARGKNRWMRCSRQSGKTSTALTVAGDVLMHEPGALVVLLTPALHQARELMRRVLGMLRAADAGVADAGSLTVAMRNGARMVAVVGTSDTSRGWADVSLLVIDEAAYVADDVAFAFFPMVVASHGSIFACSTPAPGRNWFSKVQRDPSWMGEVVSAVDVPWFDPALLDAQRRHMGEARFAQEYLAQEDQLTGGAFSPTAIARVFAAYDACTPPVPPPPSPAQQYAQQYDGYRPVGPRMAIWRHAS